MVVVRKVTRTVNDNRITALHVIAIAVMSLTMFFRAETGIAELEAHGSAPLSCARLLVAVRAWLQKLDAMLGGNMMRKQLLACMMSGLLLATMTACGGAPKNDAPDDNATYSAEEPYGESYETEDDLSNQEFISTDDSTKSSEQEAVEVPELTYRMAPLYVRTEPTEYGYTYCSYAIEVDQVGFTFRTLYLKIIDKSTGEECDWANDYDWLGYPGKVCVEETPHYGVMFSDGWFDYWETDRSTLILTIEHQGNVLAPEDIQVVTGMEFNGQDIGEYTFEVNAELEDIGYNQCKVVHGFNLLKLKGELFVPEWSSVAVGGGT